MKLLNFNRVLCISPHPDDVEYSMLGTIHKHMDTKFDVYQLAQGGDCDDSTGEHRLQEVSDVWSAAQCTNIHIIHSGRKFVKELHEDEWINKIEGVMQKAKCAVFPNGYDAIFLPNTTDSHFEHRFISRFGPALIRDKSISLIEYYTPSTQDEWCPNMYIDIRNQYDIKLHALKQFVSQQHRYYFRQDVLRAFHSDFQCSKKGIHYIEKYRIVNLFNK